MKWFTREWLEGALTDEEWARRRDEYAHHLNAIGPKLSDGAEKLIASVSLHDARLKEMALNAQGAFRLSLIAGDLQRGYEKLTLIYQGAELVPDELPQLDLGAPVEVVDDEVDLARDGRYEHRMILSPEGELGIRFHSLGLARRPAEPSERE